MINPSGNFILTPIQLFNWAKENLSKKITFLYVTKEEIAQKREFLLERFNNSKVIKQTRSYHAFLPIKDNTEELHVKTFAESKKCRKVRIQKKRK
jgi:hypothetical protein